MKSTQLTSMKYSQITPQAVYQSRRQFIQLSAGVILGSLFSENGLAAQSLTVANQSTDSLRNELTPYKDVTHYNNFYEFGTGKEDPAQNAQNFKTQPWTITIEGEVNQAKTFDIETILKLAPLEERIYRLRCVEAWSMVIPWIGFSLAHLLKQVEPTGNAKFVEFISLHDPEQMSGQKTEVLQWPYREGLRLDEAMHPLTLLAVGLYNEVLPPQNGAPIRVVIPWKYGFKSAKSIVKIRLVEKQPLSSWTQANPAEYGFYSNVNPQVDHPRWTQAKERRIGDFLKRPTLPFNGYGEQVAQLYTGMDLIKNF